MPTEETRRHFEDNKIYFSQFKILPMMAHEGSTKIFITEQKRLLQYIQCLCQSKINIYSGDNFFQLKRTSSTKVLFQPKYAV